MHDATGLGLAYKPPYNTYMHNTMLFISGTHSINEVFAYIITPIAKSINTHIYIHTCRYVCISTIYIYIYIYTYDHSITMLDKHTHIDTIVGHSLGDTI